MERHADRSTDVSSHISLHPDPGDVTSIPVKARRTRKKPSQTCTDEPEGLHKRSQSRKKLAMKTSGPDACEAIEGKVCSFCVILVLNPDLRRLVAQATHHTSPRDSGKSTKVPPLLALNPSWTVLRGRCQLLL